MKAGVYHRPRHIRIEKVSEPEPGPGELLIEVSRSRLIGDGLEELLHHADRHLKILVDPA